MRIFSNHLNKLEALAATGMPGAYKVLIFFLIQQVYGLDVLGNIASWQSIAQILGFFTAIGWSSLVLVRVAKAKTKNDRVAVFNNLAMMGGVTMMLCVIGTMLIGALLGNTEDAIQTSYWLVAWTLYQIPRHYLIALKAYRNALYLDATIITFSICVFATVTAAHASLWLALSMLVGGIVTFCLIQKGVKAASPSIGYEIKGLEFGFVNFLSSGISLSLIPLAVYFEGQVFAGVISLFVSVVSMALLIPRAISLNQLPQLAKFIGDPVVLSAHMAPMRRQINQSNVFASLVCLAIGAVVLAQLPASLTVEQLGPILFLAIVQNTLSTHGLVDTNILMAMEKSRHLLKINIFSSLAFFTMTAITIWYSINNSFLYLCLIVALINYYRLYKIRHYAKLIHDSHTAL